MSNQRERAEKWLIKVGGGLVCGVIGTRLFGGELYQSIWTYIGGVALVYVLCFLMLLLWFGLGPQESAKMVVWPAGTLLVAGAPGRVLLALVKFGFLFALFLWLAMWAVLILGAVVFKATGKKEFKTWKEMADFFAVTFWKKKVRERKV